MTSSVHRSLEQSSDGQPDTLYSTSQLADAANVTARTIRFYESKGLLRPQFAGSTRVYTYKDRARLELILRGKRLGFSLDEIAEYLDLYDADPEQISQIRHIRAKARERATELKSKLNDIQAALDELDHIEKEAAQRLTDMGVSLDGPPLNTTDLKQIKMSHKGIDR